MPEGSQAVTWLKSRDKKEYPSYSDLITEAVNFFCARRLALENDPYLETRQKEDRFLQQMEERIEQAKNDLRRLQKEKDVLSLVSIRKRRDLTSQIEEKEAEIAKLQKRKKAVMQKCDKTNHAGMQEVQKQIAMAKAAIRHVDDRQAVIHETIAKNKRSFLDLLKKTKIYEIDVLEKERMAIRPITEAALRSETEEKIGAPIQEEFYVDSLREAEASLTVQEKQQLKEQAAREEKQKKNDWFR